MTIRILTFILAASISFTSCAQKQQTVVKDSFPARDKIVKTDEEWKKELEPEQFKVLCGGATEPAFTGKYVHTTADGIYTCAACGLELFDSKTKFDSGSGWPSYYKPVQNANIIEVADSSYGMVRIEIRCARCNGHLGHVFDDGPNPTGMRYCVNSAALELEERK